MHVAPPSTHHLLRSEVIRGCLRVAASVSHQMCSWLHKAVVCAQQVTHVCLRLCACTVCCPPLNLPQPNHPAESGRERHWGGVGWGGGGETKRQVLPAESRKVYGTVTLNYSSRMHSLPERDAALLIRACCDVMTQLCWCSADVVGTKTRRREQRTDASHADPNLYNTCSFGFAVLLLATSRRSACLIEFV